MAAPKASHDHGWHREDVPGAEGAGAGGGREYNAWKREGALTRCWLAAAALAWQAEKEAKLSQDGCRRPLHQVQVCKCCLPCSAGEINRQEKGCTGRFLACSASPRPCLWQHQQKKSQESINSRLQLVMKSGKFTLGYKTCLKSLRSGKCECDTSGASFAVPLSCLPG